MRKKLSDETSVVDTILNATESDLAAIDTSILELTGEITKLENSIASLRTIRRAIDEKLHGKRPRQMRQKKVKDEPRVDRPESGSETAKEVYDLLFKEGSMPIPAIAARLNTTPAAIGRCISASDWFDRSNGEVKIKKT